MVREPRRPILNGSILQLRTFIGWPSRNWDDEFDRMGAVGMDHLVIQWVTDIAAFEPNSSPIAQTTIDCVRRVMASAATRHIGVWLGLASNDRWDNGAPFTDGEVTLSIQVLQELCGL